MSLFTTAGCGFGQSHSTFTAAVELGKLERSDRRGTVVSVRGTLYVLETAAEVYDTNVTRLLRADSGSDVDIEADAGLEEVDSEDIDEEVCVG
jgi:hypothetical protein